MTQIEATEAAATVDSADQRLLWTGAAANGALLLSYIAFAGSGPDPLAAIRYLTPSIVFCGGGIAAGYVAITWQVTHTAVRQLEAIAVVRLNVAKAQMASFKDVLTAPSMDPSVAELIWGRSADDQVRRLILERLKVAGSHTDSAPQLAQEALNDLDKYSNEGLRMIEKGKCWLSWSFVCATLSVGVLLGGAWLNI